MRNIVIISGGSGNEALMSGLLKHKVNDHNNITVITNAYDNGKSTGVCRAVTNTLGVSDIRKNHYRFYKYSKENPDPVMNYFYECRYDLGDDPEATAKNLLQTWGLLDKFGIYVHNFFARRESRNYEYKSFNIANIVYAEMYAEYGYEYTNRYFERDFLKLKNCNVIMNSFDNVFVHALTEDGTIVEDEGEIVEYKNADNKIKTILYSGDVNYMQNYNALDAVREADVIIISTGTFWSSIQPTLFYGDFYTEVNKSTAHKFWVMNAKEDKDSYGVTSNDFIETMVSFGLNLDDFVILENSDGVESLNLENTKYHVDHVPMGNEDGKHNPELYYNAINAYCMFK